MSIVLARQQPLRPHIDERSLAEGLFEVPTLTGSWARAAEGLTDELAAVAARYRDRQPHRFPVAVVFVVPKREATR